MGRRPWKEQAEAGGGEAGVLMNQLSEAKHRVQLCRCPLWLPSWAPIEVPCSQAWVSSSAQPGQWRPLILVPSPEPCPSCHFVSSPENQMLLQVRPHIYSGRLWSHLSLHLSNTLSGSVPTSLLPHCLPCGLFPPRAFPKGTTSREHHTLET